MHMFTASPPSPTDICSMCQVSLPVKMGRRLLNDRPALSRPHITFTELYKMFQRNFCVLSILSIHSHQFWCVSFSIFVFRCCFSLIASWKSSLFCLCMSWMCLQLHFRTNSLQPEFNSKKKRIAHDFAKYFDFMLSLLCFACSRLLIVCFCLGFCFDGICCFIRIGRASHKNHFRYDFKCSSFSVLVFVYNQSPSYLWIFIYLFVCCCYVFFSLRPNDKWLFFAGILWQTRERSISFFFLYIFFLLAARSMCVW